LAAGIAAHHDAMQTITVPKSTAKLLLILTGSLALIGVTCWLATSGHVHRVNHGKMLVLVYVGIPVFALCAIAALLRLVDPRPALIIDAQGITHRASILSPGAIRWADISRLEKVVSNNQELIAVHLKDVDAFTRNLALPKRLFMRMNAKTGHAPITIPKTILPIGLDPIYELMCAYLGAAGGEGKAGGG
jgi:hypothetical protein